MTLSRVIYFLLTLVCLYAGYYLYQQSWLPDVEHIETKELPLFTGTKIDSTQYNEQGLRDYFLTSATFEHFADTGETKFHQPQLTVYEAGNVVEWILDADLAVLDKNNQLLLTGNVVATNHISDSSFTTLNTESMAINLDNKDFYSDQMVVLQGPAFNNQGNSVKGNFDDNIATLSNQVQGTYHSVQN